jgi:hypothetical protein
MSAGRFVVFAISYSDGIVFQRGIVGKAARYVTKLRKNPQRVPHESTESPQKNQQSWNGLHHLVENCIRDRGKPTRSANGATLSHAC